jgi:GH15 family glucan-1,4-alpha-glucosidase
VTGDSLANAKGDTSSRGRGLGDRYPPIADYGLIGDCFSAALVSRSGSIDWCALPRFDSGSSFGRLLDWDEGGYCSVTPVARSYASTRRYLDGTLVLETTFRTRGGEVRLTDCFTMRRGGARDPFRQILRMVEGVRGQIEVRTDIRPVFDYGECRAWIRKHGDRLYSAIGGNDGLIISTDIPLEPGADSDLQGRIMVRAGDRLRLSIQFARPETLDPRPTHPPDPAELDRRLDETVKWWRRWSSRASLDGTYGQATIRSAIVLKALTHAPTGAMVAAPTTSLPELVGGDRNWDYRFSWVRDSCIAVRSLAELGFDAEADGFRRFVERSSAGHADELQIAYGVGGERRLDEFELVDLEGYRRSSPVRVGNAAAKQVQLDVYGHLLDLAWRWHQKGQSPDDDYWLFLLDLVEEAATRWTEKDRGIWETRKAPQHFVHSKVMCWAAVDRGIQLAKEGARKAPTRRWTKVRDEMRRAIESRGYDRRRGVFRRAFGTQELDGSLLLIPSVGFVAYDDDRMMRTTDAVRQELDHRGLLRRYRETVKGKLMGGAFLCCSFWLAECLAYQGRMADAREVYGQAVSTGNDLGLFAEEFDPVSGEMLGNFPQGLTHLSHIAAAVALTGGRPPG